MTAFTRKKVQRSKTLGERLQKVRLESGASLEDAEKETHIRKEYLAAIEAGDYASLPGPVYVENFLKKYAAFLGVSEEFVLTIYHQQEQRVLKRDYEPRFNAPRRSLPEALITPRRVRGFIIVLIIAGCLTYLGFEVANIFSPPELIVRAPEDYSTASDSAVTVTGSTTPEATVTINGKEIYLDTAGGFSETVTLQEGINTITITATKKRSHDTVVQRHVLLEKSPE